MNYNSTTELSCQVTDAQGVCRDAKDTHAFTPNLEKDKKMGGGGGNYLTRTDILHTHKHTYIYIYIYIVINKCVSSATQKENLRLKMTTQPIISTLDITEEPG